MRVVLACLGAGLLAVILSSSAGGASAHKGLSTRSSQALASQSNGSQSSSHPTASSQLSSNQAVASEASTSQPVVSSHDSSNQAARSQFSSDETNPRMPISDIPVVVPTERVRVQSSRNEQAQMLIVQRAQQRAQERINRIEARQRWNVSQLRPRAVRYWYYEPVLPWFTTPRTVFYAPY